MKNLLICGLLLFLSVVLWGQKDDDDPLAPFLDPSQHLEKFVDVDEMRKQLEEDAQSKAGADWDSTYRSSDQLGERGTRFHFDINHPPAGATRIGCICMDGTTMDLKGGGACAGYGGVRYWVYESKEGEEILFPTDRHLEHPDPLSEEELANLSAHNRKEKYGNSYNRGFGTGLGWEELLAIIMICATIAFVTKTIWSNNNNNNNELPR